MVNFSDLQLHDMEPVYLQIVRHLKRAIFLGEAAVGESLPSRRELAAQLCINPNTAQKAFRLMEEEGLIQTPKNAASTVFYDEETLEMCIRDSSLYPVCWVPSSSKAVLI